MVSQTMTYHFEKEKILPHDIFFAEHYDFNGNKVGHYFYCVYSQEIDKNNDLFRDVVGLLITTKNVSGYTCPINLNGKPSYVCCDRAIRFIAEVGRVQRKYLKIPMKIRKEILKTYNIYRKETQRQLKRELYRK